MSDPLSHEPHRHCHCDDIDDCIICAYKRMEAAYNRKIKDYLDEAAPRTDEDPKTSGSPRVDSKDDKGLTRHVDCP